MVTTAPFRALKSVSNLIASKSVSGSSLPFGNVMVTTAGSLNTIPGASEPELNTLKPAVSIVETIEEWLLPQNAEHSGLILPRPLPWDVRQRQEIQDSVDHAVMSGSFGRKEAERHVKEIMNGTHLELRSRASEAIDELLGEAGLPVLLGNQIREDVITLVMAVGSLCSFAGSLKLKLDIMGESSCSRWHQDNYIGRGIVTYSGTGGTMYTDNSNVDFYELEHCGNNECVIKDKRAIHQAGVGDIMFMKGSTFPVGARGLVHKSAEKVYNSNGGIVNRLLLKVDVENIPQATSIDRY